MPKVRVPVMIALVAACAVAAAFLNLPSAIRVPLGIVLMLIIPGWTLATILLRGSSTTPEEIGMLIPTLSLVVTAFARVAGGNLGITGNDFVGTWAAICVIAVVWNSRAGGGGLTWTSRPNRAAWWVAAGLAAMVVLPSVANHSFRFWGDAPFHGGYVNEIQMRGTPPENPGFVGMPAAYMWIYHVGIVALSEATGSDAYGLFFWVNGLMMFALSLAVYRIATMCWPRTFEHRIAPIVVVLGMNALGWLTAIAYGVASSFSGEVRGLADLQEMFTQLLGHPSADSVNPWLIHWAPFYLSSFIYKYLCPNTLASSLSIIAASVSMGAAFLREGSQRRLLILGLLTFCAMVVHPLVGIPACVALICGALVGSAAPAARKRSLYVALSVAVGGILSSFPIFYMLGSSIEAGEKTRIHLFGSNLLALVQGLLLVGWAAWFGLRALRGSGNQLAGFLLGISVTFLTMSVTVDYPYIGEAYLVYLAYFGVATLAVGGIGMALNAERVRRIRISPWVLVALMFLPTPLIQVQAFVRHNNPSSTWYPNEPDEIALFDYVRDHTPTNTVVIDSQLAYSPPASCYSGRRGYFGGVEIATTLGYPIDEMKERERVCRDLLYDPGIGVETINALNSLAVPVCVIARQRPADVPEWRRTNGETPDPIAKLNRFPAMFHPVLSTPTMVLYEYRPTDSQRM